MNNNETKLIEELTTLKLQYKMLQEWVEQELGMTIPTTGCAAPTSFCSSCSCGKKERIEGAGKTNE